MYKTLNADDAADLIENADREVCTMAPRAAIPQPVKVDRYADRLRSGEFGETVKVRKTDARYTLHL